MTPRNGEPLISAIQDFITGDTCMHHIAPNVHGSLSREPLENINFRDETSAP